MPLEKTIAEQQAKGVFYAPSIFHSRHASSATNAAVVLTIAAPGATSSPMPRNTFNYIHWSYNGTPTGGSLTITDGQVTEIMYITNGGVGFLPFDGAAFAENAAVTVTLAAGGAGVIGSLAIIGARTL